MHTEIFIEGQQLDLSSDIQALFTYAVADVADFSARKTGFSKTITLPGTQRNNALFGHAFEFTASPSADPTLANVGRNFNAAKAAACLVLVHSMQIFQGVLRLLEVSSDKGVLSYEVAISGELGGLAAGIGNKLLTGNKIAAEDLSFEAYNQNWNFSNIRLSWANRESGGGGSGAYFPLIDYGNVSPTTSTVANKGNYSYKAFRPALYLREYITKIITAAGYTYTCPFFDTAFFKRLIIPNNADAMYRLTDYFVDAYATSDFSPAFSNILLITGDNGPKSVVFDGNYNPLKSFANVASGQSNGAVFTYNISPTAVARVSARVRFSAKGGQGKWRISFSILKNNSPSTPLATSSFVLNNAQGVQTVTEINLVAESVGLSNNDTITVQASVEPIGAGSASVVWEVSFLSLSTLSIKPYTVSATPALYNDYLSMSQSVPKATLQRDLLASTFKAFGLYVIEDPNKRRHVNIMPYRAGMSGVADFFNNANPLDWSLKMDRSLPIVVTPLNEVTAKYYKYTFEQDSDYLNQTYRNRYAEGYGDRTETVENDFVTDSEEVKLIFAASPLIGNPVGPYAGKDKFVTPLYKITTSGTASTEEMMATKIRLLQSRRFSCQSWAMLDDGGAMVGATSFYGYAGHVDNPNAPSSDLNFGAPREIYWAPTNGAAAFAPANLFNAFHSAALNEACNREAKSLTAFFRLTPLDVATVDFSKAIYIEGQLWRLGKIIDYDAVNEGVTQVELLRVVRSVY